MCRVSVCVRGSPQQPNAITQRHLPNYRLWRVRACTCVYFRVLPASITSAQVCVHVLCVPRSVTVVTVCADAISSGDDEDDTERSEDGGADGEQISK